MCHREETITNDDRGGGEVTLEGGVGQVKFQKKIKSERKEMRSYFLLIYQSMQNVTYTLNAPVENCSLKIFCL